VPDRGVADGFGAAVNCTPEVPAEPEDVIVSHEALLDELHPQADGAITRTDAEPPAAGADPDDDSSAKVQVVPACDSATDWPAIASSPVRVTVDAALVETETESVRLPVPEAGDTVAHVTLLEAVHEQFGPFAVMPMVPVAAPVPNGLPSPVVFSVTLHGSGSCVTRNACPPMISVPDRAKVVEFGSTT
jgi:hypothetical protein